MTQKLFEYSVEKKENDTFIIITGGILAEDIEKKKEVVLTAMGKHAKIDGFRPGHVPKNILEQKMNPLEVWQQSAQEVFFEKFPDVLIEEKLSPLGQPQLSFKKIGIGTDVEFSVMFYVMPSVELPEYQKSIKEIDHTNATGEASDAEVEEVIMDLRKNLYMREHAKDTHTHEDGTSHTGAHEPPEKDLPELTLEMLKGVGSGSYESVAAFREEIKNSIINEKTLQAKNAYREKIIESMIEICKVVVPKILITAETARGKEEVKANAKSLGTTLEAYLAHRKITEAEFDEELELEAYKRAKMQIIMNAVAEKENIKPSDEVIKKEVARLQARYKDATEEQLWIYVHSLLQNDMVMEHLQKIASNK